MWQFQHVRFAYGAWSSGMPVPPGAPTPGSPTLWQPEPRQYMGLSIVLWSSGTAVTGRGVRVARRVSRGEGVGVGVATGVGIGVGRGVGFGAGEAVAVGVGAGADVGAVVGAGVGVAAVARGVGVGVATGVGAAARLQARRENSIITARRATSKWRRFLIAPIREKRPRQ